MLFLIIRNIRSEIRSTRRKAEKGLDSQVLGIFTRPQKVTEDEVTYHRERKICLVCKGDLLRSIYLCPECDAIYCIKCSEAISNIDNGCWSCYTPIDPTKPVKLKEKEVVKEIGNFNDGKKIVFSKD
jgi:predicted amidophosphoribosyltransferase